MSSGVTWTGDWCPDEDLQTVGAYIEEILQREPYKFTTQYAPGNPALAAMIGSRNNEDAYFMCYPGAWIRVIFRPGSNIEELPRVERVHWKTTITAGADGRVVISPPTPQSPIKTNIVSPDFESMLIKSLQQTKEQTDRLYAANRKQALDLLNLNSEWRDRNV